MMKTFKILIPFILFILAACAPFVDSPFSDYTLRTDRDLNQKNLNHLNQENIENDSVVRIALFTDSHQNYKGLDRAIYEINQTSNVDFVASLGDITNSGYNYEYDQFVSIYSDLIRPKLMVLGNHDSIGAGGSIFKKIFGLTNYFYESPTYRYIFFNSNNWEMPSDFSTAWLKNAVDQSTKNVIIFSHAPLRDSERFLGNDYTVLDSIINDNKVKMVINGHNHVYHLLDDNGTVTLQVERVENNSWLLLEIQSNQACMTQMRTKEKVCRSFK